VFEHSVLAVACALVSASDRPFEGGVVGRVDEVGITVTVRCADPVETVAVDRSGDSTLCCDPRRADDPVEVCLRVAEEGVDMPVADVTFSPGEFAVTVDSGEPPWTECGPDVGIPARIEVIPTESAEFDGRRRL
jgi:hypothetical protein